MRAHLRLFFCTILFTYEHLLCNAGAVPIPGCKSLAQVQEHVGALGWRLDNNEVEIIDEKLQSMK